MKIEHGTVELEDAGSFSPNEDFVSYREVSGTQVRIPMKLLVRLYEGSKYHIGQKHDWDEFCNTLFEQTKQK